jgi:hypothetical protein
MHFQDKPDRSRLRTDGDLVGHSTYAQVTGQGYQSSGFDRVALPAR